ncbi:MAG: SRPBCC family protein [Rickettsiales bacterium]
MWKKSHSKIYKNVSISKIWNLWKDVNNWPKWHDDLEYCKLIGKFEKGNFFTLKPKGGPKVKIELLDVQPEKSFIDCTKFPGAKMYDTHKIEKTKDGIKISNEVRVEGILSFLWVKIVAKDVAASAPKEMDKIAELAREKK